MVGGSGLPAPGAAPTPKPKCGGLGADVGDSSKQAGSWSLTHSRQVFLFLLCSSAVLGVGEEVRTPGLHPQHEEGAVVSG